MKRFNQIFGYKYPYYSRHALNRHAERFYNVKKENCNSWVKYNFKKIIKELYTKLCLGEIINTEDDFTSYLEKKYGNDIILIKQGKIVFVVREYKKIVTIYKHKEKLK